VSVQFVDDEYTVSEDMRSVQIGLELNRPAGAPAMVTVVTVDGTAIGERLN